jgi:hypothetical protein
VAKKDITCPGCEHVIGEYSSWAKDADHIQEVMEEHVASCVPSIRAGQALVDSLLTRLGRS